MKVVEMIRKQLKCQRGFTLVELMVVISIIGVLAAIAVPKFTDASASARGAKIQADLAVLDSAIQMAVVGGDEKAATTSPPNANVLKNLAGGTAPQPPVGTFKVGDNSYVVASSVQYTILNGRAVVQAGDSYYTSEGLATNTGTKTGS